MHVCSERVVVVIACAQMCIVNAAGGGCGQTHMVRAGLVDENGCHHV